ncbi:MAG: glycosyltransferase [Sutterellaceae bacterium]|nr:glycosyltransferase [Sutterellaceae bacterium]
MSEASPLISVIVPAFNVERELPESVASLARQSEPGDPRFEFIIMDDGSRDGTLEAAKRLTSGDPRFRVLHQRNRGCGPARNTGLDAARGKWVGFLDGDDIMMPGTLEKVLRLAEAPGVDWVFGNYAEFVDRMDGTPAPEGPAGLSPKITDLPETGAVMDSARWMEESVVRAHWVHYCWIQFARRDFVEREGIRFPPRNVFHQDILWTAELAARNPRMVFSRDLFVAYRVWPNSTSNSKKPRVGKRQAYSYMHIIRGIVRLSRRLKDKDPEASRALLRHAAYESRHFLGALRHRAAEADRPMIARTWCPDYSVGEFLSGLPKNAAGIAFALKLWGSLGKYRSK